jgi:hypothetical protein
LYVGRGMAHRWELAIGIAYWVSPRVGCVSIMVSMSRGYRISEGVGCGNYE